MRRLRACFGSSFQTPFQHSARLRRGAEGSVDDEGKQAANTLAGFQRCRLDGANDASHDEISQPIHDFAIHVEQRSRGRRKSARVAVTGMNLKLRLNCAKQLACLKPQSNIQHMQWTDLLGHHQQREWFQTALLAVGWRRVFCCRSEGIGKRTFARLLAKSLLCRNTETSC